jgi:hypothetical protein
MTHATQGSGAVIASLGFVGEVSLDGAPWKVVRHCGTRDVCPERVFNYNPPAGTIAVERRVVPEGHGDESTVR